MLKYKVGDLIVAAQTGEVSVIAHGCNCFNTMGSGIAPQIAQKWPEAKRIDALTVKGDVSKLGDFTMAPVSSTLHVYNLYSQYNYTGRRKGIMDLNYDALRSSLKKMAFNVTQSLIFSSLRTQGFNRDNLFIGLPKIGAGLAGGNWEIIEKIITEELVDQGFNVTIYVLTEEELPSK